MTEEIIIYQAKKAAEADPKLLVSAGITSIQELEDDVEKEKSVRYTHLPPID